MAAQSMFLKKKRNIKFKKVEIQIHGKRIELAGENHDHKTKQVTHEARIKIIIKNYGIRLSTLVRTKT